MALDVIKWDLLEYESARGITVPHGFTTRLGGVSQGIFDSLNLGVHRGDDPANVAENYRRLGLALSFDPRQAVLAHQVHGDRVRAVTAADCRGLDHRAYPECDALVTNTAGVALVVFTADCTPILLYDPVTGAVGAAHAGWRGTAADIAGKTVKAMEEAFGCRPEDIRAAIGPNIGHCCFQTDVDVPFALAQCYGKDAVKAFIRPAGDKYYVNLKGINALSLSQAGVKHIELSGSCTVCQSSRFWSHRVTRGQRGAQAGIIVCKEGQK